MSQALMGVADEALIFCMYSYLCSSRPTLLLQDQDEFQIDRPNGQQSGSPSVDKGAADIFDGRESED